MFTNRQVQVFDLTTHLQVGKVDVFGDDPRALLASTDGKTVCFSSPTGVIAGFDLKGNEKWRYTWKEGGGYNIRQHEPFQIDGKLFITIEREEAFKIPEGITSHKYWGRRKFIRCFNLATGKTIWDALKHVYRGWMAFALVLGWINTRLILGVLFYVGFSLAHLYLLIRRQDPMSRRPDSGRSTYWNDVSHNELTPSSLEHPF